MFWIVRLMYVAKILQVEAYRRRKSLVYAIIDTKQMLSYLQYIVITLTAVTVTVALHAQQKILIYFASILILGHFSLHAAKTIFNSIFFVFVVHPFDVGDCCVIDGDQVPFNQTHYKICSFKLRYVIHFSHSKIGLSQHMQTWHVFICVQHLLMYKPLFT